MQSVKGIIKSKVKDVIKSNAKVMGKLLLSAYIMKKINSRIARSSGGRISKYAKLMLVGYLFKKLKAKNIAFPKFEELKSVEKVESKKKAEESSIMGISKIILGILAGATVIYAVKKFATKCGWHKVQVQ